MFEEIDQLKKHLDKLRPLKPRPVKNQLDDLILRWTCHSNVIEGNTLTLLDPKDSS